MFKKGDVLEVVEPWHDKDNNLALGIHVICAEDFDGLLEDLVKIEKIPGVKDVKWWARRFKPVVIAPAAEAPAEKHVYQPGDKVVIVANDNKKDGKALAGGQINVNRDIQNGQIVTLNRKWGGADNVWCVYGSIYVYHEEAFHPYVEEKVVPKEMNVMKIPPIRALRAQAKERKLPLYSRMNKQQLFEALAVKQAAPVAAPPLRPPPPKDNLGEELRKKTGNTPYTCSYALSFSDGTKRFQVADICHARLVKGPWRHRNEGALQVKEAVCDIAGHYNLHEDPDTYKKIILWLVNHSPYRSAYIATPWEQIIREGVFLNVDNASHSRCVTAAIALREASEFPVWVEAFSFLTKAGYSESLSWLLARNFTKEDGQWGFKATIGSHSTLASSMHWEGLKKFWKEGFYTKPEEKPMSKECGQYYKVFEACSPSKEQSWEKLLKQAFNPPPVKYGWDEKQDPLPLRNIFKGMEWFEKEMA